MIYQQSVVRFTILSRISYVYAPRFPFLVLLFAFAHSQPDVVTIVVSIQSFHNIICVFREKKEEPV